jgi:hypothetical protein
MSSLNGTMNRNLAGCCHHHRFLQVVFDHHHTHDLTKDLQNILVSNCLHMKVGILQQMQALIDPMLVEFRLPKHP